MRASRPNVSVTFADPQAAGAAAEHEVALRTRWAARPRLIAAAAGLALIALACGAAGVSGRFLFLDDQFITNNLALRSWRGLAVIWGQPQRMPQPYPLSLTALFAQYQLFHDIATGYRVVNLMLHATNVLLLWTLLRRLKLPGPWLTAALFAAHPVVVDAVDWVSQQGALLCGVFYLAGLITSLRWCGLDPVNEDDLENEPHARQFLRLPRSEGLLYALSFLLFGMALLSHVSAMSWPLVVAMVIWWKRGCLSRRELLSLALFAIIGAMGRGAVAYFDWHHRGAHGPDFPGTLQRLQLAGIGSWFYALRALIPLPGTFAPARWDLSAAPLWLCLPAIAVLSSLASLFILRRRFGRGPFAAAIAYLAMLLPFLGLVNFEWMRQSWVGDHLQYLALVVPMTGVAALLAEHWKWQRPAMAGALVAGLLALSIARAVDYRDEAKLWNAVLRRNPNSVIALNHLGRHALGARKDPVAAMNYFLAALRVDPNDVTAHKNIAQVYMQQGQWANAMGEYNKALLLRPDDLEARIGLALAYSSQGDDTSAISEYQKILASDPANALAYNNLGLIFAGRGEWERAIASYRKAVELDPRFVPARLNLSAILYERGEINPAQEQLLAVTQIDPLNFEAYFSAASMVGTLGGLGEAEQLYRKAVQLRPASGDAWRNLGLALAKQSKGQLRDRALAYLNEASACFRRALRIDPADGQAQEFLRMAESDRARVAQLPPGARNAPPSTTR
jgi:tetratricopeptide (TPR) repeat protein